MKKFLLGFIFGIIGCLTLISISEPSLFGFIGDSFIEKSPELSVSSFSTPTPTPTSFDIVEKIVRDSSLSSVAIQTFQGNILKKSGSGIILSSDGLVITTHELSQGQTIQVLFEDKIFKASVVKKDLARNIALIKIDGSNLTVSDLDTTSTYESGREYILTGKMVNLSKIVTFSQKAIVNYAQDKTILIDTNNSDMLNGAKALVYSGRMVGMIYVKAGKTLLIPAQTISEFYNSALNKL